MILHIVSNYIENFECGCNCNYNDAIRKNVSFKGTKGKAKFRYNSESL